jgi:hypothetical protein
MADRYGNTFSPNYIIIGRKTFWYPQNTGRNSGEKTGDKKDIDNGGEER